MLQWAQRLMLLLTLVLSGTGTLGCQTTDNRLADGRLAPIPVDAAGRARSLVFASPELRQMARRQPPLPGLPWYAVRNELEPGVNVGYQSVTEQTSVSRTFDRQQLFNGRPGTHFHRTVHRQEITMGVQ